MLLSPPEPVVEAHEINDFFSGVGSFDDWLNRRARANQASGASRTFVTAEGSKVIGYYAPASGAIAAACSVGHFRRNMPNPILVAILGRFAIGRAQQGRRLGRTLFQDCALRVAHAADTIGIRGEAIPVGTTRRLRRVANVR